MDKVVGEKKTSSMKTIKEKDRYTPEFVYCNMINISLSW